MHTHTRDVLKAIEGLLTVTNTFTRYGAGREWATVITKQATLCIRLKIKINCIEMLRKAPFTMCSIFLGHRLAWGPHTSGTTGCKGCHVDQRAHSTVTPTLHGAVLAV